MWLYIIENTTPLRSVFFNCTLQHFTQSIERIKAIEAEMTKTLLNKKCEFIRGELYRSCHTKEADHQQPAQQQRISNKSPIVSKMED